MRLVQYVNTIDKGEIRLDARPEILREEPSHVVIDGHFQFGQVIAARAVELGISKAKAQGTCTVFVRNCNHVGRLGSYTERAAREGMVALMCVNSPGVAGVVPFGGIERRLGTNPLSMAAPRGDEPIVLDMTTSASAEGKVRVAFQKGENLPEGWIIDGHGKPSTNPADFYADPPGAFLPLGGALGFKGFGLSVMVDVLGGILSGSGIARTDLPPGSNGVWMYFLHIEHFLSAEEYRQWMEIYVGHLKGSKRAEGVEEILLPGEIENRRRADREKNGIEIPAGNVAATHRTRRPPRRLACRSLTSDSGFSPGDLLRHLTRNSIVPLIRTAVPMTFLESLQQFFWAGVDVIRSFFELFQPHAGLYIALVLWIAFWVGAVNWVRLRKILLEGGWTGIVMIGFMAVLVWGCIAPPEGDAPQHLGIGGEQFCGENRLRDGFDLHYVHLRIDSTGRQSPPRRSPGADKSPQFAPLRRREFTTIQKLQPGRLRVLSLTCRFSRLRKLNRPVNVSWPRANWN